MSRRIRSAVIGVLVSLALGSVWLAIRDLGGLERLAGDALARSVARRLTPSSEILIVTIDDGSLNTLEPEFGRWPLDRDLMARVVEEAAGGGARVVAFDILFTGENRQGGAGDARFAAAIERYPVVLATQTVPSDTPSEAGWPMSGKPHEMFSTRGPWGGFQPSGGLGTIRLSRDARSYVVYDPTSGDTAVPSLAVAAAAVARQWPQRIEAAAEHVRIGRATVPVDSGRRMLVRWKSRLAGVDGESANPPDTHLLPFDVVSLDKVLVASFAREDPSMGIPRETLDEFSRQFENRVVVVGFTAAGLINDLRATPVASATPGVEIHAMALENLLTGDQNRTLPPGLALLFITLAGAAAGVSSSIIESRWVSTAVSIFLAIAVVAVGWAMLFNGWVIPVATPVLAIAVTVALVTTVDYLEERRRSVQLRRTFGRYVSPQILEYLLENPDKVELGGARRDMTVLFSDIRGFTTISEASEPEEVVEMLNEYLTLMVEILLEHEGTLDKFIGDAVMGFWNAPTDVEDHATKAVLCAIEMINATTRLRERWEREGKAAIRIGIGIHSGEAVVGNIGSERVFGYTVIGDTVNLASRLEGKNKDYGTEIIVSESTLERLSGNFDVTYLDEVRVKGKEKAVRIFQVRGQS